MTDTLRRRLVAAVAGAALASSILVPGAAAALTPVDGSTSPSGEHAIGDAVPAAEPVAPPAETVASDPAAPLGPAEPTDGVEGAAVGETPVAESAPVAETEENPAAEPEHGTPPAAPDADAPSDADAASDVVRSARSATPTPSGTDGDKAVSGTIAPGTAQIVNVTFPAVRSIRVDSYGAPEVRIRTIDPADNIGDYSAGSSLHNFARVTAPAGGLLAAGVWRIEFHNDGTEPAQVRYEISSQRADVELTPQGFRPEAGLAVGTRALLGGEPMPDGTVATVFVTAPDGSSSTHAMQRVPGSGADWRADVLGAAPGFYVVRTAFDVDGLRSSVSFVVEAGEPESTPPAVVVTTEPAASNPRGWFARDVEVRIAATDEASGVDRIEYRVDGGEPQSTAGGLVALTLSHGRHVVEYQAFDRLGNATGVRSRDVNIDTVLPENVATVPARGGQYALGSAHTVDFSCADALSGVLECTSNLTLGAPLDTSRLGTSVLYLTSVDRAGNSLQERIEFEIVEPTTPTVTRNMPDPDPATGWYTDLPVIGLEADVEGGDIAAVHWRYTIDGGEPVTEQRPGARGAFSPRADGVYSFRYWAEAEDGSLSEPVTIEFRVDTTAPAIRVVAPVDARPRAALEPGQYRQGSNVAVDFACDDATSGVATCSGSVADGAPLPTDVLGEHQLLVEATDVAGNSSRRFVTYTVVAADAAPGERPADDGTGPGGRLATTGPESWVLLLAVAVGLSGLGLLAAGIRRLAAH